MQTAVIVAQQVFVMFLLIGVGFVSCRRGLLNDRSARDLSSLLLNATFPAMLVSSLHRPRDSSEFSGLALALALSAALHIFSIAAARLLIPRREGENWRAERFAAVYSNCGFMAFPIIRAAVGDQGVFYATMFSVAFIICQWTHGIVVLGGRLNARKIWLNPGMISSAVGLLLYFSQLWPPLPVMTAIDMLGAVNTPLSMIITGVFLAQVLPRELAHPSVLRASLLKVALLPALAVLGVWASGLTRWFAGAPEVCLSVMLAFSCPTAVAAILMSAFLNRDVRHAAALVTTSTLLSLLTLPLVTALAEALF